MIDYTTKRPWLTIFLVVALLIVAASGMSRIKVNNDIRSYFPVNDQEHSDLKKIEELFGRGDTIIAVVSSQNGKYDSSELMSITEQLTERLWRLDNVSRVDTISNYVFSSNERDVLNVQSVAERVAEGEQFERLLEEVLEADASVLNRLVSNNGLTQRIGIEYILGSGKEGKKAAVDAVSSLLNEFEFLYPDIETYLSGAMTGEVASDAVSARDFVVLTPLKFLGVLCLLCLLMGSIRLTILTMTVVIASCMATAGLAGWLGVELNILSSNFYNIVLTVGIAYIVHVLTKYNSLRVENDVESSVRGAIRSNLYPISIATVTTIVGFTALNFTSVPPAEAFGNIAAIGVVVTYTLILVLVPAFLSVCRVPHKAPWISL